MFFFKIDLFYCKFFAEYPSVDRHLGVEKTPS